MSKWLSMKGNLNFQGGQSLKSGPRSLIALILTPSTYDKGFARPSLCLEGLNQRAAKQGVERIGKAQTDVQHFT